MSNGMTLRQAADLDNYITGHYGEDSVALDVGITGNLYDAARALLEYIEPRSYRLTADTFGSDAEQAKKLIQDLRDALAEVEN